MLEGKVLADRGGLGTGRGMDGTGGVVGGVQGTKVPSSSPSQGRADLVLPGESKKLGNLSTDAASNSPDTSRQQPQQPLADRAKTAPAEPACSPTTTGTPQDFDTSSNQLDEYMDTTMEDGLPGSPTAGREEDAGVTGLDPGDAPRGRQITRTLRSRVNRRPIAERSRQRRQTMQDMARPLKQWLCNNKDNPYPTKSEKIQLALQSHMTLTQVSNWFANARRRLKNTVREPDVTWRKRINMYNHCVEGNAELLSVSSEDSLWESEEELEQGLQNKGNSNNLASHRESPMDSVPSPMPLHKWESTIPSPTPISTHQNQHIFNKTKGKHPSGDSFCSTSSDNSNQIGAYFVPVSQLEHSKFKDTLLDHDQMEGSRFKNSILHRYLSESYENTFQLPVSSPYRKRNPSGSLCSHDYEEMSTSSRSSPIHIGLDETGDYLENLAKKWVKEPHEEDDMHWKEISAALTLTNLARSRLRRRKDNGS